MRVTSTENLPQYITQVKDDTVQWAVSVGNGVSEQLGGTANDIFVTYGEPIANWSSYATPLFPNSGVAAAGPNTITYARLSFATSGPYGLNGISDIDKAAEQIIGWTTRRLIKCLPFLPLRTSFGLLSLALRSSFGLLSMQEVPTGQNVCSMANWKK